MVTVREVVKRTLLVNDPNGGFLSTDDDALNVIRAFAERFQLIVKNVGTFHRGLCVELGWIGDLEQDILHDTDHIGAGRGGGEL